MTKIYYAKGMIEWHAAFQHNGLTLRILFSGGGMGSNGIIPAKYRTDNEAIQRIIEESDYYKENRLLMVIEPEKPEKDETQSQPTD